MIALGLAAPFLVVAAAWSALADDVAYLVNEPTAQSLTLEALECLKRAENAPTDAARRAEYEQGKKLAERALALDDKNADAHFARFATEGRLLLMDGSTPNPFNMVRVNRELDRVLELNPNHADALAAKGGLYRQLPRLLGGSERKAEECLNRAISLEPDKAVGARVELAQLYRDRGDPERGIPLLQAAITIAERDGKLRQRDEAKALLEQMTGSIHGDADKAKQD